MTGSPTCRSVSRSSRPLDQYSPGDFWDSRYRAEDAVYGLAPNAFFQERLAQLAPGLILLPGDGEGRNGVHAAAEEWSVRTVDASAVGVSKAKSYALDRGVVLDAECGDVRTWEPGETFDVVALSYLHLLEEDRGRFHRRVCNWLRPGGTLILEGFGPGQLAFESGGPKSLSMLFTEDMLAGDFADLAIEVLCTRQLVLNEGPHHQGLAEVTRMVARKPHGWQQLPAQ